MDVVKEDLQLCSTFCQQFNQLHMFSHYCVSFWSPLHQRDERIKHPMHIRFKGVELHTLGFSVACFVARQKTRCK